MRNFTKNLACVLFLSLVHQTVFAGQLLTLDAALKRGLAMNPDLQAAEARAQAEHDSVGKESFLDNPRFGLSEEKNMNLMEQQTGPMQLWSVSQEIKFPTKYFLMGDIQNSKAKGADQVAAAKRLEIRQKIISAYYSLYVSGKTVALLEAQRETLREIARIAESKHATGAVPQQDEMKAHVEQTKIENEILTAKEDQTTTEATLNALLNQDASESLDLPSELALPRLTTPAAEIQDLAHTSAAHIRHGQYLVEEAQAKKNLALWSWAPDFNVTFKKAYTNAPQDNYAIGVELTFPLWFLERQSSEVSAARSEYVATQRNFDIVMRNTHSEVRSLVNKTQTHAGILKIYQTSLIPQAESTLNSSRASYRAGRSTFSDLLDSERSLYGVRIAYYQMLTQYVDNLTKLEEMVGTTVSNLPSGDSR